MWVKKQIADKPESQPKALKLIGRTRYTPDFKVIWVDSGITAYIEVKAAWYQTNKRTGKKYRRKSGSQDSPLRITIATNLYPEHEFYQWELCDGEWSSKRILPEIREQI